MHVTWALIMYKENTIDVLPRALSGGLFISHKKQKKLISVLPRFNLKTVLLLGISSSQVQFTVGLRKQTSRYRFCCQKGDKWQSLMGVL